MIFNIRVLFQVLCVHTLCLLQAKLTSLETTKQAVWLYTVFPVLMFSLLFFFLPLSVPGLHSLGWQDSSSGGFSALLVRCYGPWCHLAVCKRGPAAGCPDGYRAQRYEPHLQTGFLPQPGWRYSQRPVSGNKQRAGLGSAAFYQELNWQKCGDNKEMWWELILKMMSIITR